MANPIFIITDGTSQVDLLSRGTHGIHIKEWEQAYAQTKGGGVFSNNPLADGRQLVMRKWDNVIETLTLTITGGDQDGVAAQGRVLIDLLQKAVEYWTSDVQPDPVYVKVRGSTESNLRYGLIYDYRIDGFPNPFASPLFNCPATADEVTVVIERGHWLSLPPGQVECVQISSIEDSSLAVAQWRTVDASSDDATVNESTTTISLTNPACIIGTVSGENFSFGMRFTGINIPPGVTITGARLKLVATIDSSLSGCDPLDPCSPSDVNVIANIEGEDVDDAATFSTYADYAARARTTAFVRWSLPTTDANQPYFSPNIGAVIQEIVDRPGWAAGNDIVVFVTFVYADGDSYDRFAAWDHASLTPPRLVINYTHSRGQEPTCEIWKAHVSNKRNSAQITAVYIDDGGAFSGNLINTALPYNLFPAVPAANDALYIGSLTALDDSGPFSNVIFSFYPGQEDLTIDWEYWNGAWVALTVQDGTAGGGEPFSRNNPAPFEVWQVVFEQPVDWVANDPGPGTGYWIRANISAVGASPSPPTQINRQIYSVTWPSIDIGSDQIAGDIAALARVEANNRSDEITTNISNRLICGLRSKSRGDSFTPFINFADEQNPDIISISVVGATTTFANDVQSSTGRIARFNPGAATSSMATIAWATIEDPELNFKGRFRIFLRAKQEGGADEEFSVRMAYSSYGMATADIIVTRAYPTLTQTTASTSNWQLFDFGTIDLPIGGQYFDADEGAFENYIRVQASHNRALANILKIQDLILVPCDEWFCDAVTPTLESPSDVEYIVYDSATFPRKSMRVVNGNPYITTDAQPSMRRLVQVWRGTSSEIVLAPNTAQRLWFLSAFWDTTQECWKSYPETLFSIRVHKNERWLGMRGAG